MPRPEQGDLATPALRTQASTTPLAESKQARVLGQPLGNSGMVGYVAEGLSFEAPFACEENTGHLGDRSD